MNILIMGPAGAGKGTMSDLILKEYNIAHISTGDMLRENVRNSTALGLEAQSYMNQGKLVPDDLINAMVEDRIQQPDCANGYLLDGFPRTLVQAEVFDKIAEKIGKEVDAVIDLQVKFEILEERITGRYIAETIVDPDNNEVAIEANQMCTPKTAGKVMKVLAKLGRDNIKIRTILSCKCHTGVCAKCYGANMATGQVVQVGEAVGIIAAQSIGEPGTQLTMRTFHTGGVAGGDITQGLPRVEELFEARKPKGLAIISELAGVVEVKDIKKKREIVVTDNESGESRTYLIPYGSRMKVQDGQVVEPGDALTEGSVNPHDILKIKGVRAVQDYMIQEVQRVYRLQGVEINDKHVEVIVRQMLKKVKIEESNDSEVLPGVSMDVLEFNDMNEKLIEEGKTPAEGKQVMLGITKASLATDSFLSAASFQETTKVLTEAAINGKVDSLYGLKENVILGKLIPAGTGMKRYRNVKLSTEVAEEETSDAAVVQ